MTIPLLTGFALMWFGIAAFFIHMILINAREREYAWMTYFITLLLIFLTASVMEFFNLHPAHQ